MDQHHTSAQTWFHSSAMFSSHTHEPTCNGQVHLVIISYNCNLFYCPDFFTLPYDFWKERWPKNVNITGSPSPKMQVVPVETQLVKPLILNLYRNFYWDKWRVCCPSTCKPALGVPVLCLLQPGLVPGMGEVHQQDELDQDEDEGAHHAKVIPHWDQTEKRIQESCWGGFKTGQWQRCLNTVQYVPLLVNIYQFWLLHELRPRFIVVQVWYWSLYSTLDRYVNYALFYFEEATNSNLISCTKTELFTLDYTMNEKSRLSDWVIESRNLSKHSLPAFLFNP